MHSIKSTDVISRDGQGKSVNIWAFKWSASDKYFKFSLAYKRSIFLRSLRYEFIYRTSTELLGYIDTIVLYIDRIVWQMRGSMRSAILSMSIEHRAKSLPFCSSSAAEKKARLQTENWKTPTPVWQRCSWRSVSRLSCIGRLLVLHPFLEIRRTSIIL